MLLPMQIFINDFLRNNMNDDEKGKRFLELIDEQSNLQWSIVAKISALIKSEWNSNDLKTELNELVDKHTSITKELNSLDEQSSML